MLTKVDLNNKKLVTATEEKIQAGFLEVLKTYEDFR